MRALGERENIVESRMAAGERILWRDKRRQELRAMKPLAAHPATGKMCCSVNAVLKGVEFTPQEEQAQLQQIMLSMEKKPSASEMGEYIVACHLKDPVLRLVEPRWLAENLTRFLQQEDPN